MTFSLLHYADSSPRHVATISMQGKVFAKFATRQPNLSLPRVRFANNRLTARPCTRTMATGTDKLDKSTSEDTWRQLLGRDEVRHTSCQTLHPRLSLNSIIMIWSRKATLEQLLFSILRECRSPLREWTLIKVNKATCTLVLMKERKCTCTANAFRLQLSVSHCLLASLAAWRGAC